MRRKSEFTPISETMSIPTTFICGVPSPGFGGSNSKFRPSQIKFFGIDEVVPASETSIKKVPATLKRLVNHLRQQNINTYMYYTTNIFKVK